MTLNLGRAVVVTALVCFTGACERQTAAEKVEVVKNDVVRGGTKAVHRVEEAVCAKGDVECFARKAQNRASETAAAVADTASEVKDKIDGQ